MAKVRSKAQFDEDWELWEEYADLPPEGTWRRIRILIRIHGCECMEARDGKEYTFKEFLDWYGPAAAERCFNEALQPLARGFLNLTVNDDAEL